MPNRNVNIPRVIRDLRDERGWTQEALGNKLDPPVTGATVSRWENGESLPSHDHLRALARLMKVDPGVFVDKVERALKDSTIQKRVRQARIGMVAEAAEEYEIGNHEIMLLPDGAILVNEQVLIYPE